MFPKYEFKLPEYDKMAREYSDLIINEQNIDTCPKLFAQLSISIHGILQSSYDYLAVPISSLS